MSCLCERYAVLCCTDKRCNQWESIIKGFLYGDKRHKCIISITDKMTSFIREISSVKT